MNFLLFQVLFRRLFRFFDADGSISYQLFSLIDFLVEVVLEKQVKFIYEIIKDPIHEY
jgi:hypothetical protein